MEIKELVGSIIDNVLLENDIYEEKEKSGQEVLAA